MVGFERIGSDKRLNNSTEMELEGKFKSLIWFEANLMYKIEG